MVITEISERYYWLSEASELSLSVKLQSSPIDIHFQDFFICLWGPLCLQVGFSGMNLHHFSKLIDVLPVLFIWCRVQYRYRFYEVTKP